MFLYGAGQKVKVNNDTIDAIILAVMIISYGLDGIEYRISYWSEGERVVEWVNAIEISAPDDAHYSYALQKLFESKNIQES